MRGKLAKRLRRYVAVRYPFLSEQPLYRRNQHTGQYTLAEQCQRALYKTVKRNYKKRQQGYV